MPILQFRNKRSRNFLLVVCKIELWYVAYLSSHWTFLKGIFQLIAARSNGTVSALSKNPDGVFEVVKQWEEVHEGKAYVGLSSNQQYVVHSYYSEESHRCSSIYTCTSHGSLRMYKLHTSAEPSSSSSENHKVILPTRLQAWQLTSDGSHFAYCGKEVELSVWDTRQAFESKSTSSNDIQKPVKRKRGSDLLPGEIWRAKGVSVARYLPSNLLKLYPIGL